MAILVYQVIVTETTHATIACVPELRSQAVGTNRAEAIANVKRLAEKAIRKCEADGIPPPVPSRMSIAEIHLPEDTERSSRRR
jgi:hypothetical protein